MAQQEVLSAPHSRQSCLTSSDSIFGEDIILVEVRRVGLVEAFELTMPEDIVGMQCYDINGGIGNIRNALIESLHLSLLLEYRRRLILECEKKRDNDAKQYLFPQTLWFSLLGMGNELPVLQV